jgi:hypothetical protein
MLLPGRRSECAIDCVDVGWGCFFASSSASRTSMNNSGKNRLADVAMDCWQSFEELLGRSKRT